MDEPLIRVVWTGRSREPWMLLEGIILYEGVDEWQRVKGRVLLRIEGEGTRPREDLVYTFLQNLWRMHALVKL